MRVLYIQYGMHHKNHNALQRYDLQLTTINNDIKNLDEFDLNDFDMVYSPSLPFESKKYIEKYPHIKFLFGPHFSVFPVEDQMRMIKYNINVIYIQPSEWTQKIWRENQICDGVDIKWIPFGVETDVFKPVKPLEKRTKCFVYFKRRDPQELKLSLEFLISYGFNPVVFDYCKGYDQKQYIDCLNESKFGFWLDAHESQGFALQEALSCDVPLIVWNVTSMKQEYGSSYPDIPATTIPYWDNSCGEAFTKKEEMKETFQKFINRLETYQPRKFILENLTIEKCSDMFKNLFTTPQKSPYFNTTIELKGGLGNQLFQLFTLISYSLTNNLNFCIPDKQPEKKERPFYWDSLLSNLKPYLYKLDLSSFKPYQEPSFRYNPIPKFLSVKLDGYFQSYKYFEKNFREINNLLNIEGIRDKYRSHYNFDNLVSLHFRLGDYLTLQNYHPVMTKKYYVDALNSLLKTSESNLEVLYFCEEGDKELVNSMIEDISKEITSPLKFQKIDSKYSDWENMMLMSLCKHNIIANSSFSWWGAYFNTSSSKQVYYPSLWFGPAFNSLDTRDICPENWIKINC